MDLYAYVELLDEMRGVDTDHEDYDYDIDATEEWLANKFGMSLEQAQSFLSKVIKFTPKNESMFGNVYQGFVKESDGMVRYLEREAVES